MSIVLHLSDPHFGTARAEVVERLLDLAHALRPDIVVMTGDLTQRATEQQFREAAAFVRRMPETQWVIQPGNHDRPLFAVWERLRRPFGRFHRVMGLTDVEPVLDAGDVQITCVDTTRSWRQQLGALSGRQIDAVATRLCEARPGTWRIVACHHPLAVQRPVDRRDRPWGHRQALERWSRAGMDLLLCGHIHVPSLLPLSAADGPHPCWLSQAGSACSRRLMAGQPNSVNVLSQRQGLQGVLEREWTRWDHDERRGAFVPVERVGLGLPVRIRAGAASGALATPSEAQARDAAAGHAPLAGLWVSEEGVEPPFGSRGASVG